MQAKIKVTETILAFVRSLGESPDPEERIAAAEHEIVLQEQLEKLRKQNNRRRAAVAGRTT